MAKNYFGVVLTTKEHDKYRLVVYRYKDPGILNTCPMCQLLRAIHKFQQEYTEIHREHCSRIPPRKWYELGRVMPSIVLRKYGLEKHYEMSFEPSRVPPASALCGVTDEMDLFQYITLLKALINDRREGIVTQTGKKEKEQ